MKSFFVILFICLFGIATQAQTTVTTDAKPIAVKNKVVEAACGECMFHMPSKGCDLAVKIDGKSYFVDGTGIEDHGDAHADDGFCNAVRKAEVTGNIVNDRFIASSFKLLPAEKKKP